MKSNFLFRALNMHKNKLSLGILSIFTFFSGLGLVYAQDPQAITQAAATQPKMNNAELTLLILICLTIVVTVLVLATVVYTLLVVRNVVFKEIKGEEPTSVWSSINQKLTNAVPIEKEKSILLDHNYDGIRELDNHLPPWWVYLFYGTVVFGVLYMFNYHVLELSPLSEEEYEIQMETAALQVAAYKELHASNIDETNVTFVKDDQAAIAEGNTIFQANCAVCHGEKGEGATGPNLTDEFWLHGGGIKNVFSTIKYGVPKKGMISWEKKLKPDEMQNVASFILTLEGTNPPNAKEPQGDKYVPEEGE